MGVITVTERQTFKRCRKKWDYASHSRQNLESIVTPTAFSLGRMVHEALEKWTLEPDSDPVEFVMQSASEELERTKTRYKAAVGVEISDSELEPFWDNVGLARTMIANYKDCHKTPIPEHFTLVGVEQTFLIPIPGSNCARCQEPKTAIQHTGEEGVHPCEFEPHYLEATLDIVMRGPDGRYWVGERKTYKARPKIEALNTNDQFLAYCWVLREAGLTPVGGVAYDGLWKRDINTPSGRASSRVQLKDLFTRLLLTRSNHEIDTFGEYLVHEANEMCDPDIPLYLNRRWEGCFDCNFERLCSAEHKGDDVDYVRESFYTQRDTEVLKRALEDYDAD